jgi:Tol biopolymer transport system component
VSSVRAPIGEQTRSLVGIDLGGKELWSVTGKPVGVPAFNRDGTKVAFQDGTQLSVYDVTNATVQRLGISGANPAWSPDGGRLAYDDGSSVGIVDVVSLGQYLIGPGTEPSWTPDGKGVAVRSTKDKIELVDLTTRTRRALLEADLVSVPRWSSDGVWMAYSHLGGRDGETLADAAAEPHQIIVRDVRSGAEASVGVYFKADPGDYRWVANRTLCMQ